jgi:seryl-tRNA synthetase
MLGNLPKFSENLYFDDEDDLWLIPTAEVPLTSLHHNEILQTEDLPLRYVALTPSFRREKMAWGRDTRGIKRVHQFNKVELYKLVEPQTSEEELAQLIQDTEEICQKLDIPYRVVELCAPELGFSSQKTYDIEMWALGSDEWLEVSSCSNCGDFQARRSNIRYRPQGEEKTRFVHTLNDSGLALPRVFIAILENYQTEKGDVKIPEAIRPYVN